MIVLSLKKEQVHLLLFFAAAILGLVALSPQHGFAEPPPEAYLDPVDQQIVRTRIGIPGRPVPCAREFIKKGIRTIKGKSTEECFKLLPPQRWVGLWRNDFEGSQFCPAPAATCSYNTPGDRIWLTENPSRRPDRKLYAIEFIGRRTMYKGAYGHMGASDHEMIMDKLISLKERQE